MKVIAIAGRHIVIRGMISSGDMNGTVILLGLSSDVFHDINFSTGRPSFLNNVSAKQPESRPDSLAKRKFCSYFKFTIGYAKFIECSHSCRSILESFSPFFPSFDC